MRRHVTAFGIVPIVGLLLLASPVRAEDPTTPPPDRAEFCKQNPGKCEEARAKRDAFCKENPEKCEQVRQKRAERREFCKQNPEKCAEQRERMKQRRAEMQAKCAADPAKCEEMKKERRERFQKRHGGGSPPAPPTQPGPPEE
jgi:hypothetical protein